MVLPLSFDAVLTALQSPPGILVADTTGAYIDGVWVESEPEQRERPIEAIVLAMNAADLRLYREGAMSAAGIALHTKEKLYFTDIIALPEGVEGRQSYVLYQGYRFRVAGTGLMAGNTTSNLYHCIRYVQ